MNFGGGMKRLKGFSFAYIRQKLVNGSWILLAFNAYKHYTDRSWYEKIPREPLMKSID